MPMVECTCRFCGKRFEAYPSIAANRQYCSQPCRSRHRAAEFMPLKPRRGDTIPCDVCGTPFYRSPGEIRRDRRFCSVACSNKGQAKGRIVKTCPECGETFSVVPSQASIVRCSKRCEGNARMVRPLDRSYNGRPARLDNWGYVLVWEPTHPNKSIHGWQYEHRLVAEAALGRYLGSDEHVHHVNGVKHDNCPENLQVLSHSEHSAITNREARDRLLRDRAELEQYRRRFGPLPE